MNVERPISRRTFIKNAFLGLAGMFAFGSALGGYATAVEPYWLEVSKRTIKLPHLPETFDSLRLMHLTDLHYLHPLKQKHVAALVQQVQKLRPDLICFTGDLADHKHTPIRELIPHLRQLQAPLGKFAINGNHDLGHADLISVFQASGFTYLHNEHQQIERNGATLVIAGVEYLEPPNDQPQKIHAVIQQALQGLQPDKQCIILLAHAPDYADQAKQFPIDLQLSGHSHGGQIKLPFIGPIFYAPGAEKYVEGLYQWNHHPFKLYVDRGIGCSILPIRFLCRPQMTLIELRRK